MSYERCSLGRLSRRAAGAPPRPKARCAGRPTPPRSGAPRRRCRARCRPARPLISRPSRASRARQAPSVSPAGSARRRPSDSSRLASVGSSASSAGAPSSPPGGSPPATQFRGQVLESHGHVQADPQHRPGLLQAALDEDPRNLRQAAPACSTRTSLGHLISAVAPTTSATATAAASGSICGGWRRTTESSSELPAGADHVRPCRPPPALCSPAVTIVPCGAPAIASSRARELVESVSAGEAAGSRALAA